MGLSNVVTLVNSQPWVIRHFSSMGPIKKSHIRLNHNSIVKFRDLMFQGPINKAKLMSFLQLSEKFPNADLTGI